MMETAKIGIRYTKDNFANLRRDVGTNTDWELRTILKGGKNGLCDRIILQVDTTVNESENLGLGRFKSPYVRKIDFDVPKPLAKRFNKLTYTRPGEIGVDLKFNAIADTDHQNLLEYHQEGADRRLQNRNKLSKFNNNGPRIYFKDSKEDSLD